MADNVREQIGKAQRNILDHLARYEDSLGETYDAFSSCLPDHAAFWNRLVKEEREHARLLRGLEHLLARGFIFYDIGRFNIQFIENTIAQQEQIRLLALRDGIDIIKAGNIALDAESSVLDNEFFKVVKSDCSEFQVIARHLTESTQKHANKVRDLLVEVKARTADGRPKA